MRTSIQIEKRIYWPDWLMVVLGLLLLLFPFIFQFPEKVIVLNSFITGIVVFIIAGIAVMRREAWNEFILLLLGGWLIFSPWILEFSAEKKAFLTTLVVGGAVFICAIWAMKNENDLNALSKE